MKKLIFHLNNFFGCSYFSCNSNFGTFFFCSIILAFCLIFGSWTIQLYSETGSVTTNIALVGIGGVILGTILLITGTILYSIANVVKEK